MNAFGSYTEIAIPFLFMLKVLSGQLKFWSCSFYPSPLIFKLQVVAIYLLPAPIRTFIAIVLILRISVQFRFRMEHVLLKYRTSFDIRWNIYCGFLFEKSKVKSPKTQRNEDTHRISPCCPTTINYSHAINFS